MKKILTLKHWQVFLVLGLSYIISIALWDSDFYIGSISALDISVIFGIVTLIFFFLWILTLGLFVNSISENPYRFRKGLLIFSVLSSMTGYVGLNLQRLAIEGLDIPIWFSTLMAPLTAFGIIYTFYNVPKSLKSIELDRKVSFKECIVDTILLFVFPIGIWFIQPRINRLFLANELLENEEE
jgi:hypothetical protein